MKKSSRKSKEKIKKIDKPPIHDVFFDKSRAVVFLRPRLYKVEVELSPLISFLRYIKKPALLSLGVLFFIGLGLFYRTEDTKAEVSSFYPESCLGGWRGTHNAEGSPQLTEDASSEEFDSFNSAVLENTSAQIFCGGFKGTIPPNTDPEKVFLKFSWVLKSIEVSTTTESISISAGESATSSIDAVLNGGGDNREYVIQLESASTTSSNSSQHDDSSEPIIPSVSPSFSPQPSSVPEETPNEEGTTEEEISPPQESIAPAEEALPTSEENEPETTSFLNLFLEKAYAMEEEATSTSSLSATSSESLFNVEYTIDGIAWKTLGTVTRENFNEAHFQIPPSEVVKWEDLSRLQIRIDRVPSVDDRAVYLDGLWLEAQYIPAIPLEVEPIPGELHISGISADRDSFSMHGERDENNGEILVISAKDVIGGVAIYNAETGRIVLVTKVDGNRYVTASSYFGEGRFEAVNTSDTDLCNGKSLPACKAFPGNKHNSFIVKKFEEQFIEATSTPLFEEEATSTTQ